MKIYLVMLTSGILAASALSADQFQSGSRSQGHIPSSSSTPSSSSQYQGVQSNMPGYTPYYQSNYPTSQSNYPTSQSGYQYQTNPSNPNAPLYYQGNPSTYPSGYQYPSSTGYQTGPNQYPGGTGYPGNYPAGSTPIRR